MSDEDPALPPLGDRGGTECPGPARLHHDAARPAQRSLQRHARVARAADRHESVRVLSGTNLLRYLALAALWGAVSVSFWAWWLGHRAHSTGWLYWSQTIALAYQTTVLPSIFWWFLGTMRRPLEQPAPGRLRVALITLCVPSHEATEVIRRQLEALVAVSYPHDSWILDEEDSGVVRALAGEYGVSYFTRHGVPRWNQPRPPFQQATKAGNVNAWLDHVAQFGRDYDVFIQFDIDHRPRPDYIERTLGYFSDPEVAWVQAPSVAGNLEHWTARGLTEQDLVLQGPLQMGFYGFTRTPFIIGSHTSYRTEAVRAIGGFQPTRAEDHLDTVVLAAAGYKGVYVPEVIAVGDGPTDLTTYLRQQFAWAYSMIQIFIEHTPRLIRRYSPGQALQFLFAQSWYTLWSLSLAVLWALPSIALVVHRPIASVDLGTFLEYFVPLLLASGLMWCESRRWFQPSGVRLSVRGVILQVARWPVVLWALVNVLLRIRRPYMITRKGLGDSCLGGFGLYVPGFLLALVPLAAAWVLEVTTGTGSLSGYYGLAFLNAAVGIAVVSGVAVLDISELAGTIGARPALRAARGLIAALLGLMVIFAATLTLLWEPMIRVLG